MLLGEMDLYLFGEGRHHRLWDVLGAHVVPTGTRFAVWAPNARSVAVVGDWNGWQAEADPLLPEGVSGIWGGLAVGAQAGSCYKFAITDASGSVSLRADPMARRCEAPPANASIVVAPSAHRWADDAWLAGRALHQGVGRPLRIYELHVGSWRPGLGYRDMAEPLADYLVDLGFTHVELMPVAEHPYTGSWGYQVTGYFAPTARWGTPDDLRYLVDHLHQRGIGVIVDWVPAHFPKDDWALARFDGTALYEHSDPRQGEHPDWGTLVFNYGRHEVRNFLVANALYWIDEFHIDGLRVDAVASMLYLDYSRDSGEWVPNQYGGRENLEALGFLRELNTVVHGAHPGVLTIAEESTAWPQVTHPVHHGGLGFTHKWNMGWMHDTLGYFAHDPVHRRWHHRELTFGLLYAFTERFCLPLSHDEVVHGKGSMLGKMAGDEWQQFANLRSLYSWMWAYPGAPLVFMGGEFAQWGEWSLERGVDWAALDGDRHRGVRQLVHSLNHTAAAWPALFERNHEPSGFQWLEADDMERSVFAFMRWSADSRQAVVCIANFTPVPRHDYVVGLPWAGWWHCLINSDDPRFGGSGHAGVPGVEAERMAWHGQPASARISLPPLGVVWLGADQ
jgi:1,4-alpha-glucan branching enzyme